MIGIKQRLEARNSKDLKIEKLIAEENILSEDPDKILFEGEMQKYKPGINIMYIKRWAQLSRREFKYYKDRYHSAQWLVKPLGAIPLNCIEKIARVDINVTHRKKPNKSMQGGCYQFEIFAKKNIIDFKPSFDLQNPAAVPEANYKKFVQERGKELVKVQAKKDITPKNPCPWIPSLASKDTWSSRQKEWESAENRLLFALPSKEECDKWVLLLNWLVDLINQELLEP